MKHELSDKDPAFPVMAMEILNNVLSRADNPGGLGTYLTEEVRDLTGARCVLLIQCLSTQTMTAHSVVGVNPLRRRAWAESPNMNRLYMAAHQMTTKQLWQGEKPSEVAGFLRQEGFGLSMVFPLTTGEFRMGTMLVLGLPDEAHITSVLSLLGNLSTIVALVLRNAILFERQEQLIQERTAELRDKNEELEQRVSERTALLQRRSEELELANESLKEVDQLKSSFIASMSHELRTPLNCVIGFSSILLDEWLGPLNAEQKQNLASILNSGRHLLSMINDVLDVTQIESGTIKQGIEEFDLYELLANAESEAAAVIREKGLELQCKLTHQQMRTDRRRLLQCVRNILGNAAKFTDKGTVTVEARIVSGSGEAPAEEIVEIAITDTGIGIGEADLPRIFTPFHRIVITGREIVPGTGLGLFLTQKITTEILKGELLVSSEQGKGSRFSLRIPVRLP